MIEGQELPGQSVVAALTLIPQLSAVYIGMAGATGPSIHMERLLAARF
jgi:hypothetical protein